MPHQITNSVVVGGWGQVGRQFTTLLLASGVQVQVIDIKLPQTRDDPRLKWEQGDVTDPSDHLKQLLAGADCVFLAIPEQVALAAALKIVAMMRPGSLLVDTLSVKTRLAELLRGNMGSIEAVSLNPMFSPSLAMTGRPVAVVTLAGGPRAQSFLELVTGWGGELVYLEAAEHDRIVASVQAATHLSILAFGLALKELGTDVQKLGALSTPPHLTLLALLARMASGVPEVYWDIQAGNPHAAEARAALRQGIERLTTAIESRDEARFADLLAEMQTFLQDEKGELSRLCAEIFESLPPRLHSPAPE